MPAKPWKTVYNAKHERPACIQKNALLQASPVFGEEDCLYLNIYRPMVSVEQGKSSCVHSSQQFSKILENFLRSEVSSKNLNISISKMNCSLEYIKT